MYQIIEHDAEADAEQTTISAATKSDETPCPTDGALKDQALAPQTP